MTKVKVGCILCSHRNIPLLVVQKGAKEQDIGYIRQNERPSKVFSQYKASSE